MALSISTVLLSNFPSNTRDREVENMLRFVPQYEGCSRLNTSPERGTYAFAKFATPFAAMAAVDLLDNYEFDMSLPEYKLRAGLARRDMEVTRAQRRQPYIGEARSMYALDPMLMPRMAVPQDTRGGSDYRDRNDRGRDLPVDRDRDRDRDVRDRDVRRGGGAGDRQYDRDNRDRLGDRSGMDSRRVADDRDRRRNPEYPPRDMRHEDGDRRHVADRHMSSSNGNGAAADYSRRNDSAWLPDQTRDRGERRERHEDRRDDDRKRRRTDNGESSDVIDTLHVRINDSHADVRDIERVFSGIEGYRISKSYPRQGQQGSAMMFVGFHSHDAAVRAIDIAREKVKDTVIELAKRNLKDVH